LGSFAVEIVSRPSGSVLHVDAVDGSRYVGWYLEGNKLFAYIDDAEIVQLSWSATEHRWLRIAREDSKVVFSTSPDGSTWVQRATSMLGWAPDSVTLGIGAGRLSGKASSGGVLFDNATVTPAQSAPAPTLSPTSSGKPTATTTPTSSGKQTATTSPTVTTPPTSASPATEAAVRYGWGTPFAGSEFTDPNTLLGDDWDMFWGPGYQGEGWQSQEAFSVSNGVMSITGDSTGLTGAVGYFGAMQRYGRWESRIRVPQGDGSYHPVALLWPTQGTWPSAGEIDYFETSGTAVTNSFSIHHGGGQPQVTEIAIDRNWHNYAVEWTSTSISAYLDGEVYYRTTDRSLFPPFSMWHSFQLDWMGYPGSVDTVMEVDWLRIYQVG